jgi:dihydroorotase
MFDLLIRDATIVTADSATIGNVGVEAGKIALVGEGRGVPLAAHTTVDGSGLHLLPGLVDAHVHFREPGLTHKEDFGTGTLAAAAGGVTTVMVMPTDNPITFTAEEFAEKRALAEQKANVDFALHAGLGPDLSHVEVLARMGAISFELFLADVTTSLLTDTSEALLEALARTAAVGTIAGITSGDHDLVTRRTRAVREDSKGAWADFPSSRPPISEALGVARACVAARETGARIHFRQISCAASAEVLAALRPLGSITAEVMVHNLLLDESELLRQGPRAKVAPPLRPAADLDAVLAALRRGKIDIVATDHAPHSPEEKAAGMEDIWKAPAGLPGVQTLLPAMLKLVGEGKLGLSDVVRYCATEPARIFGLYPRKGALAEGADADLLLIDMLRPYTVRDEDQLTKARYTPFHGLTVRGAPVSAWLRGTEIMREGHPTGAGRGVFLALG